MKKNILAIVCLFLVVFMFCTDVMGFRQLREGETVKDFSLQDLEGKTYSISGLKGKTIVILYWRVGQERSHQALKELKSLHKKLSGKPLQILAVTKDADKLAEIKALKQSLELPFPVLLDSDAKVYSDLGVLVFPSTALIDSKGVFRFYYGGFRSDYQEDLFGQVRLLLGLITPEKLRAEKERVTPRLSENQKRAINHIKLAKTLRDRGMDEKAFQEAEKAVKLDPDNAEGYILYGFCLLDINKTDQGLANFQKALKLNPRSTDAKIGLGTAYRMKGQTEKALEILKSGLSLCPDSAVIHLELGKIYESIGKNDEALKQYKASAECSVKMRKRSY